MRFARIVGICFALCLVGMRAWSAERPTLSAPVGTYEAKWFTLEGSGEPCPVFIAWRDGNPVQFWAVRKLLPGVSKAEGTLKLLTDKVSGDAAQVSVELRLVSIWAPIRRLALQTLRLNIASGEWSLSGSGKEISRGKLTPGPTIHSPITSSTAWSSFYGVMTSCQGPPYGKPMVADLAQASPLWRSEAVSLSGWGTGVDARYAERAAHGTLCGGSSSPVVAEGMVFLYHYRPSGDVAPEGKNAELLAKFQEHPVEQDSMRRFFSSTADVVVTAIDGETGKTVWQSVWPNKQGNHQTHKWRGANPTPAVAEGVLVVADYSRGLYAHRTQTGELLWTWGGGSKVQKDSAPVGPVICGSVVVYQNIGFDLQTGRQLWKVPAEGSPRRMIVGGQERVLIVGQTSNLVEPATGRVLWTSDFVAKDKLLTVAMPICDGDKMVAYFPTTDKQTGKVVAYTITDAGPERAWESESGTWDENLFLAIANGRVYAAHRDEGLRCLDLSTGRTLGAIPELKSGSNAGLIVVDDRVFLQPEGQHGRQQIQLVDGVHLKPLGEAFVPQHNDTTAYGQMPLGNVVVDGRLIIRGMDGLYCYDLRLPASGRK